MACRLTSAEAYDLAMHLIAWHRNSSAIYNDPAENADQHDHEHHGPGGIRNHPFDDLSYDPAEVEVTLEEAEADGGG